MKVRRLKIRGKTWRIILGKPPANDCSAYIWHDRRTIWIRPSQSPTPSDRIDCIVHEILHACLPDIAEEVIDETEKALLKGLELVASDL